ncbi:MAG: family 43 glycosylhydrolase [Chitinispirillaceae bacterium]|nr:family 43 glycosylhydrolase [Chitinispirillaceae bacterium]
MEQKVKGKGLNVRGRIVKTAITTFVTAAVSSFYVYADNQIVPKNIGTSDPQPNVFEGVMYLYCTEDMVGNGNLDISVIHCYSTTDLYHWKDEGVALSEANIPWCSKAKRLWAPHCCYFGGKHHLYFPETDRSGLFRMGHATANSPTGPFTADANYMAGCTERALDPYVAFDTGDGGSGKRYLVWNQVDFTPNDVFISELKDDGTDVTGPKINLKSVLGASQGTYKEGTWLLKRNNLWYLIYADWVQGNVGREVFSYSTNSNIMDQKYAFKGQIMKQNGGSSATMHPGVFFYNNQWVIFWHNGGEDLGGSLTTGFKRVTCAENFEFNADGSIPTIEKTWRGIGIPEAYEDSIQIDRRSAISGASVTIAGGGEPSGWMVSSITNNGWVRYDKVHFDSNGPAGVNVRVASKSSGGSIEFHLGSNTGKLLGTIDISSTGSLTTWQTLTTRNWTVSKADSGVQNIACVFKTTASSQFNVNWVKFIPPIVSVSKNNSNCEGIPGLSYKRLNKNIFHFVITKLSPKLAIALFTMRGRKVEGIVTRYLTPNSVEVSLNPATVAQGSYVLVAKSGDKTARIPFIF